MSIFLRILRRSAKVADGAGTKYFRDDGKWMTPSAAGLPDYTGNAGKVLAVNGTADGAEWITAGGEAFPIGSVFIAVVSTNPATLLGYGTWSAFGAGRVMVGRDAGDTDFDTAEETGGAKTVAASGSVSAPTISGSTASGTTGITVGDHASHTHTYSEVLNHTHAVTITDPGHTHTQTTSATDGASGRADASSGGTVYNNVANINSATTGITATTDNPAGGVATGTTAGPSVTLTHSVTDGGHTHGAGTLAASAPTFTGSATSVVQPYIVCYFWKRTA